jgi:hypothetical protein
LTNKTVTPFLNSPLLSHMKAPEQKSLTEAAG